LWKTHKEIAAEYHDMANVTFTFNPVPAPACYPPDFNGLAQELTTGGVLVGTIPDTAGGGVFVGSSPPSSALANKVWFVTDSAGRPLGVKMFYNGNWRRVYTGALGDIKLYIGPFNGVFDGTGRGIVGGSGAYDEDGWAVCNGNNGTQNLEGYFPCGASWSGSAWVANPEGTGAIGSGGSRGRLTIQPNNLPGMHVSQPLYGAVGAGCGFNLTSGGDGAGPCGTSTSSIMSNATGTAVGGQSPISMLPLFIAMAYLQFVGYT
jgi:hypothetical protein